MEKLFQVRYWDYSHKKFNFQGQICLSSTIAWGVLSILLIYFLHPPIESFITEKIPKLPAIVLAVVLSVIFVCDFAVSFRDAWGLRRILEKMTAVKEEITELEKHLNELKQERQDRLSGIREGSAEWLLGRRDEYLQRLQSLKQESLSWLADIKTGKPASLVEFKKSLDELAERLDGSSKSQFASKIKHLRTSYASLKFHKHLSGSILKRNPGAVSKKFNAAMAEYKTFVLEYRNKRNYEKEKKD